METDKDVTARRFGYLDRMLLAMMKTPLDMLALQALRKATRLLSLALASRLAELRDSGEPIQILHAKLEEHAILAALAWESVDIHAQRWDKIPDRRRPHYRGDLRFRILRLKDLLGLSRKETARLFRVSPETVANWEHEVETHPASEFVGSRVKPIPPVKRYRDVCRHTVQTLFLAGIQGCDTVAQTLARAGWRISARTAGRIRRERPVRRPPTPAPPTTEAGIRAVRARYPGHVAFMDLTDVPDLFRILTFKVATLLDGFSRMPIAAKVFDQEPTAAQLISLVEQAAQTHGTVRHFVSDQGGQFTAKEFRESLVRLGTRQRVGAIGKTGSIAVIERFFRTLKEVLSLRRVRPLTKQDLENRLQLFLVHYAYLRPHQGLGGAAPAEVYFGIKPAHLSAVAPPRGRPGEGDIDPPFEIAYLDPERRLPFLIPAA